MKQEIWKCIEGYDGEYLISSLGEVKSLKYNKESILKKRKHSRGYYQVTLTKNKIQKQLFIHRLVAKAFIPNPENKTDVNHLNGIKTDNNLSNLEWATAKQNTQHAWQTGLCENSRKAGKKNLIKAYEAIKIPIFSSKLNMQFESIRSASIYVKEHYFNNSTVGSISTAIDGLIAGRRQTSMYDYGWEYIK